VNLLRSRTQVGRICTAATKTKSLAEMDQRRRRHMIVAAT